MKVTQRFIAIGLIATVLIALSSSQIIVQPGYSPPGHESSFESSMPKSQVFYKGRLLSLDDEFQRNVALHRELENQLLWMSQAQPIQEIPPGMVEYSQPPIRQRSRIDGAQNYPQQLYPNVYGAPMQAVYAGKSQRPRSVLGGPRTDVDDGSKIFVVASKSPINGDIVYRVDNLPVPEALVSDDSTAVKIVEPRQASQSNDATVGSPLNRIHYDQPRNLEQHHPLDSQGVSSQLSKAAHAAGQIIKTVAPGMIDSRTGQENKDPRLSMARHRDPMGNYYQSNQESRNKSPNISNVPRPSSAKQSMTEQYNYNQQLQKFGSSLATLAESSQNPRAKVSGHEQYLQQGSTAFPAAKYWEAQRRQGFGVHPNYRNYRPVNNGDIDRGDNPFPDYNSYQNQPQSQGFQPNVNGYPSNNNYGGFNPQRPHSGTTSSASTSANNYSRYPNGYNPDPVYYNYPNKNQPQISSHFDAYNPDPVYHNYPNKNQPQISSHFDAYNPNRASYSNPYPGSNGFSTAVDQFGRTVMSSIPSAVNNFAANPNNMGHLKRAAGQQLPEMFRRTAVDQFGRAVMNIIPSAVNRFAINPNNMDYLKRIAGQQLPEMFKQTAVDEFGRTVMINIPSAVNRFAAHPNKIDYLKRIAGL